MNAPISPLIDAAGQIHAAAEGAVRIVSLVPSITELLCELGLREQLVGRTGFCVHPELRGVPKVGGTKDVNIARVRELAPTHLIVNIDENRREVVEELGDIALDSERSERGGSRLPPGRPKGVAGNSQSAALSPRSRTAVQSRPWDGEACSPIVIVTHPCTPEDNLGLYRLLGGIFRREAEAASLSAQLADALAGARAVGASLPREAVLYLIWREPWMTVARSTYISATLAAVGWDSVPAEAAERYPTFAWDAPWLAGVRRVLLSSEPYRFGEKHLAEVAGLSGCAVQLVDGEMASWYGSRAIAGLRYLTALRLAGRA
jgi:hypothetical protein